MLFIRFSKHCVLRGILLGLQGDTIRVALEDSADVAEYRRIDNGWIAESGESVEIEFRPMAEVGSIPFPLTAAAERSATHYFVS